MADLGNLPQAISFDPPPAVRPEAPGPSTSSLKRRASDAFADRAESAVKRAREDSPDQATAPNDDQPVSISGQAVADDLADELMCGCCSALLYRPVVVNPCQHYFCGR
jgi:E3 ubiquitin-protein ligase CHFR